MLNSIKLENYLNKRVAGMRRSTYMAPALVSVSLALLSACNPVEARPVEPIEKTPTEKPVASATYTQEPTLTPTPRPFEGILFFDANGSGKQESDELGLAGFTVCLTDCVQTDNGGYFLMPNNTGDSRMKISITDPTQDTLSQMNYVTQWEELVRIPAWDWNGINYPEQFVDKRNIFPIRDGVSIQAGIINYMGLTKSNLGLCPIDMSAPGIWISNLYSSNHHLGLDIAGPFGEPHFSPGNCNVIEFYVGDDEGNGMLLECSDIPLDKITLHHIDFRYNNYETLVWYGIPIETFFKSDGSFKLGVLGVKPNENETLIRGENLHIYMGTTGYNSARIHTHITAWTFSDGKLSAYNDPQEYFDCFE